VIGQLAGNYKILSCLGEGGMGTVYKAVDVMLEREVAIKMLRPEIASQPQIVERFRTEAVTLAKLNHPSIATLYSFFRQGDHFFMVMEYVAGQTLDSAIRQSGALPADRTVAILSQALEGIAHAHSLRILHRDLKPANIMLPDSGGVKVMDFGIARLLSAARMTRTGGLVGTLEYVAPERVRGQEADLRSDLYSMGIVLYEMLSGRVPFQSDTEYELMRMQLEQAPPVLASLGVATPPALEAALVRVLAKNPEERFASAAEFRAALLGAAAPAAIAPKPTRLAGPPPAKETRMAEPLPAAVPAAVPRPAPATAPRRKTDWKLYGGAAAVIVVFALGAAFWAFRKPAPAPAATTAPAPVRPAPSSGPLASNAPSGGSAALPGTSPLGQPDLQSPQNSPNPVKEVPSARVIALPPDSAAPPGASPGNKRAVAAVGASAPGGPPLSLPEVLHLLNNQTSSQVVLVVERRGVNFLMSPDASAAIQNAGGNHALVAAISRRHAGGAAAPEGAAPPAPAGTQVAAVQSPAPVVPAPQPQIPAVQAPPPSMPVAPPRAGAATLMDVRALYIAPMANDLNLYLAGEIQRQLGGRIQVVATADRADAIMAGTTTQRGGVTGVAGRAIGVQSDADASVVVTDRAGTRVLWRDEATSRSVLMGVVRKGGPRKLAEHLVSDMKKALR
jgi:serine/threonine-protein kinase